MRIAVLVTNTDRSDFAARHPRDGEKFRALLRGVRPAWQVSDFDLTLGEFPDSLAGFDGVVIGGSPASVHDSDDWIAGLGPLIRQIVAAGTPVFGACFGHPAIARALGGTVADNPGGWVLGVTTTRITAQAPWMVGPATALRLNAAHTEQVTALPPGAEVLSGNDECPFGTYRIGTSVFATQYHPEMTDDFIAALVEEFGPALSPGLHAKARASLAPPADTALFAEWIARFFEASGPA